MYLSGALPLIIVVFTREESLTTGFVFCEAADNAISEISIKSKDDFI